MTEMQLKPGEPHDVEGSMAFAIKEAWEQYWRQVMPGRRIPFFGPFLDVLFVAIAQGVVRHLQDHPRSFIVEASGTAGTVDGTVVKVETTGVWEPAASGST